MYANLTNALVKFFYFHESLIELKNAKLFLYERDNYNI